jgi:hypothetical protein
MRSVIPRRAQLLEISVKGLEDTHHGREGRVHLPGLDAREIGWRDLGAAGDGDLRDAVTSANRGESPADIEL